MPTTDLDFAYQVRDIVARYLAAVDAWERKHGQTYRLPSRSGQVTPDLADETAHYRTVRGELEALVPRARLLYHVHGIREPFTSLLHVNLGAAAPQSGIRASIGGNERTEVARGLVDLIAACASIPIAPRPDPDAPRPTGLIRALQSVVRRLL